MNTLFIEECLQQSWMLGNLCKITQSINPKLVSVYCMSKPGTGPVTMFATQSYSE